MSINPIRTNFNNNLSFSGLKNLEGLRPIGTKLDELTTIVGHEIVTMHEKCKPPRKIPVEIIHESLIKEKNYKPYKERDHVKGKFTLYNSELQIIANAYYEKEHLLLNKIANSSKFGLLNIGWLNNILDHSHFLTYISFDRLWNFFQKSDKKINGITNILGAAVEHIALDKTGGKLRCLVGGFGEESPLVLYLRKGLRPLHPDDIKELKCTKAIKDHLTRETTKKRVYKNGIEMYLPKETINKIKEKLVSNPMINTDFIA